MAYNPIRITDLDLSEIQMERSEDGINISDSSLIEIERSGHSYKVTLYDIKKYCFNSVYPVGSIFTTTGVNIDINGNISIVDGGYFPEFGVWKLHSTGACIMGKSPSNSITRYPSTASDRNGNASTNSQYIDDAPYYDGYIMLTRENVPSHTHTAIDDNGEKMYSQKWVMKDTKDNTKENAFNKIELAVRHGYGDLTADRRLDGTANTKRYKGVTSTNLDASNNASKATIKMVEVPVTPHTYDSGGAVKMKSVNTNLTGTVGDVVTYKYKEFVYTEVTKDGKKVKMWVRDDEYEKSDIDIVQLKSYQPSPTDAWPYTPKGSHEGDVEFSRNGSSQTWDNKTAIKPYKSGTSTITDNILALFPGSKPNLGQLSPWIDVINCYSENKPYGLLNRVPTREEAIQKFNELIVMLEGSDFFGYQNIIPSLYSKLAPEIPDNLTPGFGDSSNWELATDPLKQQYTFLDHRYTAINVLPPYVVATMWVRIS